MWHMILLFLMITTSMVTMLTNHLTMIWMMMELTNLMFIMMCLNQVPMIKTIPHMFTIQFISSMLILLYSVSSGSKTMNMLILQPALMMKFGLYPFDYWIYTVLKYMEWKLCLILLTLMKIPPLMIIPFMEMSATMFISLSLTPLIATFKSINMASIKLIMAPSSLIHSSWMILLILINYQTWASYFMIYTINTSIMIFIIMNLTPQKNYLYTKTNKSNLENLMLPMVIFSLVMAPPFTSFFMKIKALESLSDSMIMIMPYTSVVSSSMFSILLYGRIFLTSMMLYSMNLNKMKKKEKSKIMLWISMIIPSQTLLWVMIY